VSEYMSGEKRAGVIVQVADPQLALVPPSTACVCSPHNGCPKLVLRNALHNLEYGLQ